MMEVMVLVIMICCLTILGFIIKHMKTIIIKFKNKAVVLEGVEEPSEDLRIKEIKHPSLYVQGYYYNKPMNIKALKNI